MDLSVLIPSRNEMFLKNTVEDVLAAAKAETEVIVVADGGWPVEGLTQHPRVTIIHRPVSIGQRAATNEAARVSGASFLMKLDAHCSLAEGFDLELLKAAEALGDDVTQIPTQKNLHAFDWVCACGARKYQGPTPKECSCAAPAWRRELIWKPRRGVTTTTWRFDKDLHFQYWGEYSKRKEYLDAGDFPETMSCLGACFFMSRERFWELGGLDEAHGSWGQMGTEVACKSWLSGGRMVTNKKTWFAHMFRTQGGDFGFPYEIHGSDQDKARSYSRSLWKGNRWAGQKRPLSWLIEHFSPVPGWEEEKIKPSKPSKGVIYYSDCRGDEKILSACRKQLKKAAEGLEIVAVTLSPLEEEFTKNLVLPLQRGILTMFKQILAGLEASTAEVVFLAEHDILYHPSHFDFTPPRKDAFYYNLNVWKVDASDGKCLHYLTKQTSGLCAYRELLVEHYRKRIAKVEQNARDLAAAGLPVKRDGYSRHMGFEPGCHSIPRGVDNYPALDWWSEVPNVDIRHGKNLTPSRWSKDLFRDKNSCLGWTEAKEVPGWGKIVGELI